MHEIDHIQTVLGYWELHNPCVEEHLNGKPPRLVYAIKTDSGQFVLKGYPCEIPETTISSNVQAHLFLGNEKGLAPSIYPQKNGRFYLYEQGYWFYLMEFIRGRQMEETPEDEYRLGQAAKKLHALQGYSVKSPDDQSKKRFYE